MPPSNCIVMNFDKAIFQQAQTIAAYRVLDYYGWSWCIRNDIVSLKKINF